MSIPSKRPYLLRALYEWMVDAGHTPYLLVDAVQDGVVVPEDYVEDGRIVLNLSPSAVRDLDISNDQVVFDGRFGGIARQVFVPMSACLAVYARETGEGMMFEAETSEGEAEAASPEKNAGDDDNRPATPGSHLKVIK